LELRFWVGSKGPVPRQQQANLLRPFHLLHQQTSAGLGLSLVERMVSLQGGRTGYEPGPDDQSLFYFTLPANPSDLRGNRGGAPARPRYAESRPTT
jgi:K+-sensing histidine kinase KdpD